MEEQMIEKKKNYKIKPLLIDKKYITRFYEKIIMLGYQVKIWNKKKDNKIYKYYLPLIREYMFWTFNLNDEKKFRSMSSGMQAAICNNYSCTIFEKEDVQIVCFNEGIVFIIGESIEKKIVENMYLKDIESINIDKEKVYKVSIEEEEYLYSYILSLYKLLVLNKLNKDMENKDSFYKNRKIFVKFMQDIYTNKITDSIKGNKFINECEEKLGIEKLYIAVENKFDLLYKNNRLDNHENMFRIVIILLIVLIIIGTINLGNWIV